MKKLAKGTISDGNAGLGTQFTAIAHNMVRPNGHIALILPLSAMLGGSDNPSARSWLKLRNLLREKYKDVIVVTIAQNQDIDCSFSADTKMGEVMIIARSLGHEEQPSQLVDFVNLNDRPENKLAAQQTAKAIKQAIRELGKPGSHAEMKIGDEQIGTVRREKVRRTEKWTTVRVKSLDLN